MTTIMEKPRSCDTFVVLPPLTINNVVIFGKNSDRPQNEVQEVILSQDRTRDSKLKVKNSNRLFNFTKTSNFVYNTLKNLIKTIKPNPSIKIVVILVSKHCNTVIKYKILKYFDH